MSTIKRKRDLNKSKKKKNKSKNLPKATQLVRSVTTVSYIWYLCPNSIVASTVVPLTIPNTLKKSSPYRVTALEEEDGSLPLTWLLTDRKEGLSLMNSFFLILILFHKENYTASSEPLSTHASQASTV